MSIFFFSDRIGKNGRPFKMIKFRTLKRFNEGSIFIQEYTWCGRFLRKYKLDELPQIWNILMRDMNIVGPRPEEKRMIETLPEYTRKTILSVRPGLTDLASLFFFNEEKILEHSENKHKDYWTIIRPMKTTLQAFYIENRCLSLDLWIIWQTIKRITKAVWKD